MKLILYTFSNAPIGNVHLDTLEALRKAKLEPTTPIEVFFFEQKYHLAVSFDEINTEWEYLGSVCGVRGVRVAVYAIPNPE